MPDVLSNNGFVGAFLLIAVMIAAGFVFRRKGIIGAEGSRAVTAIVWKLALPCMAFCAFMEDFDISDLYSGGKVLLFAFVFYALFLLLGKLTFRSAGAKASTVAGLAISLGQLTLFTMPLLASMGGDGKSLLYAGIMTIAFRVMLYVVAFSMIAGVGMTPSKAIRSIFGNGVMIAMLLGALIWCLQGVLPQVVIGGKSVCFARIDLTLPALYAPLSALSKLVSPLSMFIIGLTLGEQPLKFAFTDKRAYFAAGARLLLAPLAVLAVFLLFPSVSPGADAVTAMVLGFAAPASVTLDIFCVQYRFEEQLASRICTLSALASIVTVPAIYILTAALIHA